MNYQFEAAVNKCIVESHTFNGNTYYSYLRSLRDFGFINNENEKIYAFYPKKNPYAWSDAVFIIDFLIPLAGSMTYDSESIFGFQMNGDVVSLKDSRNRITMPEAPPAFFELVMNGDTISPPKPFKPYESFPAPTFPFPFVIPDYAKPFVNSGKRWARDIYDNSDNYFYIESVYNERLSYRESGKLYVLIYLLRPLIPKELANYSIYQDLTWGVGFPQNGGGSMQTFNLANGDISHR